MEPFYSLFCAFLIFGHTIPFTDAGLLDPLRNIFETNQRRSQKNRILKQFLLPLRGSKQASAPNNLDFDVNDPILPLEDQNLPMVAGSSRIIADDPNARGLNPNGWWPDETTHFSPTDILAMKPQIPIDYDKIVNDAFPEVAQLIDKLKKLNHAKEQQRLHGHNKDKSKGKTQGLKEIPQKVHGDNIQEQNSQVQNGKLQDLQAANSHAQIDKSQDLANSQAQDSQAANSQTQNDVNGLGQNGPDSIDSIFGQNGLGQNGQEPNDGVGQNGLGQNGLEPNDVLGQNGLGQNGLGQNGLGQNGLGPYGLGQNGVGQNGVGQNGLGGSGLGQNGLGQTDFGQNELGGDDEVFRDKETTSTTHKISHHKSYNSEDIRDLLNNAVGVKSIPVVNDSNKKMVLKKMSKRKFYYQARPVIPESDRNDINETVYYVESS